MQNIVVVDTKLLAYDTFHRRAHIFNLFDEIYSHCCNIPNPKIVFAFDSRGGSRKRKELYPGYKANRQKQIKKQSPAEQARRKNFLTSYYALEDFLPYFGNVISIDGYEADDIANIISHRFGGNPDINITLLSSDKDWAANFQYGTNISQIALKKGLITHRSCEDVYGLAPEIILPYQALVGVEKENIKGVYKLGVKTFGKLYSKHKNFDAVITELEDLVIQGKGGMRLPEGYSTVRELYEFNWKILAPILFDELSAEEQDDFKHKFSYRFPNPTQEAFELDILQMFNTFYIFNSKIVDFFKLPKEGK